FEEVSMLALTFALFGLVSVVPQEPAQEPAATAQEAEPQAQGDDADAPELTLAEADARLPWRTGEIELGNGMARLALSAAYRYLDPQATARVLEDVWGNPPGDPTWGMIFPADRGPFHENAWAVVLRYADDGHVDDADASKIDYDEL